MWQGTWYALKLHGEDRVHMMVDAVHRNEPDAGLEPAIFERRRDFRPQAEDQVPESPAVLFADQSPERGLLWTIHADTGVNVHARAQRNAPLDPPA